MGKHKKEGIHPLQREIASLKRISREIKEYSSSNAYKNLSFTLTKCYLKLQEFVTLELENKQLRRQPEAEDVIENPQESLKEEAKRIVTEIDSPRSTLGLAASKTGNVWEK